MRLVKGAKGTFGWVVVGIDREIVIPPEAWERYGFHVDEQAIFISGSRKSGGFGLTNQTLLANLSIPLVENRILGYGWFTPDREVRLPESIPVQSGDRLLTAFGSGYALGFIAKGPIFDEANRHPEIMEFRKEES